MLSNLFVAVVPVVLLLSLSLAHHSCLFISCFSCVLLLSSSLGTTASALCVFITRFFHTLHCLARFAYTLFNFLGPSVLSFFFRLCVGFPDVRPHIPSAVVRKPSLIDIHSASTSLPCSLSSQDILTTLTLY